MAQLSAQIVSYDEEFKRHVSKLLRACGVPIAIVEGKRQYPVERVQDRWQLNDEWWRSPIERHYFELVMADGRIRTVYHDRRQEAWFEQRG